MRKLLTIVVIVIAPPARPPTGRGLHPALPQSIACAPPWETRPQAPTPSGPFPRRILQRTPVSLPCPFTSSISTSPLLHTHLSHPFLSHLRTSPSRRATWQCPSPRAPTPVVLLGIWVRAIPPKQCQRRQHNTHVVPPAVTDTDLFYFFVMQRIKLTDQHAALPWPHRSDRCHPRQPRRCTTLSS